MSIVSVRLPDKLLKKADSIARTLHLARSEYIRKAIEHMNEESSAFHRKQQLIKSSLKTRSESMLVNAEFSRIEHEAKD